MFKRHYEDQVRLLLQCLPEIGRHEDYALKGGTAINLTKENIGLSELVEVQHALPGEITSLLEDSDKQFLLSVKRGDPEWHLLGIGNIDKLPAIRWKLMNIEKMSKRKRQEATERLVRALGQ